MGFHWCSSRIRFLFCDMILLSEILFLIANITMAHYHAELIEDGKKIRHGLWGGLYLLLATVFSILNHSWILFLCSLLIRKVFFDLSLNLFRHLPLFYVSKAPDSIIDKIHWKIFGFHSEWYMGVYLISVIVLNFFM